MGESSGNEGDRAGLCLSDLPEAAFLLAGNGRVLVCNAVARRQLGLSPTASTAEVDAVLDPLGHLGSSLSDEDEAGRSPRRLRLECRRPDGSHVALDLTLSPSSRQAGAWIALARDCDEWLRIEHRLQRRLAFEQLVTSASAALIRSESDQLDGTINTVLGELGGFFGVDRVYVFLIDYEAQTQSNTHEWVAEGISAEAHNLQGLPLDVFPWLMGLLRSDQAMVVDRVSELPAEAVSERTEFEREGIQSILVVPMWHGQRLRGFVGFDAVRQGLHWNAEYVGALRLVAQMLAGVLESRKLSLRLSDLAFHDYLTGLPNRVLFEDRLDVALQRIQRKQRSLWLAMVDLDDFKEVNDGHGHAAGDEVLKEAARRFQVALRQGDTVARLGGDEFVLVIEDEGEQSAESVAGRLLGAFQTPFEVAGAQVAIGLSIGLARGHAGQDKPADLLRRADVAMYRAKAAGKNRWAGDE
ncbi:MAG TPA: diguanylate cyclase [Arenimonas sp.]|nr:diguanylate cyclase [Arenimonas sp.]